MVSTMPDLNVEDILSQTGKNASYGTSKHIEISTMFGRFSTFSKSNVLNFSINKVGTFTKTCAWLMERQRTSNIQCRAHTKCFHCDCFIPKVTIFQIFGDFGKNSKNWEIWVQKWYFKRWIQKSTPNDFYSVIKVQGLKAWKIHI